MSTRKQREKRRLEKLAYMQMLREAKDKPKRGRPKKKVEE